MTGQMKVGLTKAGLVWLCALVLAFAAPARATDTRPKLPTDPIVVQLTSEPDLLVAHWGSRKVWVQRMATDSYRLRLMLGSLLGEMVERYEFNMPRISGLTLADDETHATLVRIHSLGDTHGKNYVSDIVDMNLYVSQDVLDLIEYADFSFTLPTYSLSPLPEALYLGKSHPTGISVRDQVFIHRHNPGILERPGKWGWDVPGSPDWRSNFSFIDIPLAWHEWGLPQDRYMNAQDAKEGFKRMLFRHHVLKQPLFVNNSFHIQNLEIDLSRIMSAVNRINPKAYDYIMQLKPTKPKDDEALALIAGVERSLGGARGNDGVLNVDADLGKRMSLVGEAFGAFRDEISDPVVGRWREIQQKVSDAQWERRLAGTQVRLVQRLLDNPSWDPGDDARAESARLVAQMRGSAGAALVRHAEQLDHTIQLSRPMRITSHQDGEHVNTRVIDLAGEVKLAAGSSVVVRFNGAEQNVSVADNGNFSTKVVVKSGDNDIAVCREDRCVSIKLVADVPELALMATLTWDRNGDLDLHVRDPQGRECNFSNRTIKDVCGLDVDDQHGSKPENISVATSAPRGSYRFWVVNYNGVKGASGTLKIYRQGQLVESRDFYATGSNGSTEVSVDVGW